MKKMYGFSNNIVSPFFQELYNEKKQDLETGHKQVKEDLKEKLHKEKVELNEECQQSISDLETKLLVSDSG